MNAAAIGPGFAETAPLELDAMENAMRAVLARSEIFTALKRFRRACALVAGSAALWSVAALGPAVAADISSGGPEAAQEDALRSEAGATGAVKRSATPGRRISKSTRVEMMVEGGGVRGPRGYERFCRQDPRYCAPPKKRHPGATVRASQTLIKQLEAFNRSVNAEFEPALDRTIYGVSDHWTFPTRHADCEDYVLAKQARLLKAGWPREALLIGVVVGEESPFHAVLIVRTSKGELVLDNMTDEVRDWRDTGYRWVIRQSSTRPERWVRILGEGPSLADEAAKAGTS